MQTESTRTNERAGNAFTKKKNSHRQHSVSSKAFISNISADIDKPCESDVTGRFAKKNATTRTRDIVSIADDSTVKSRVCCWVSVSSVSVNFINKEEKNMQSIAIRF